MNATAPDWLRSKRRKARPLVALDVDGVLRTGRCNYQVDREAVATLNTFLRSTGARILFSSFWRQRSIAKSQALLQSWGVACRVIGNTPDLFDDPPPPTCPAAVERWLTAMAITHRGGEIQAWLSARRYRGPLVIFDDEDDMGHLLPYLVQTNPEHGLTAADVEAAVALLRWQ